MADIAKLEDPIWEYTLNAKLSPYIPVVRLFWKNIDSVRVTGTGVFAVEGIEGMAIPSGLMYRVTNTPVRSPIKNVQVFPFVPTAFLNLTNVTGGAMRMVQRVCEGGRFTIDEFTLVAKSNLPSTYHQGQFIAFVPTDILHSVASLNRWICIGCNELFALRQGTIPKSLQAKLQKYVD